MDKGKDINTKKAPQGHPSDSTTPVYVYVNGDVVAEDEAAVSIRDRGFLYGDAVFETLRSYNGNPFLLKDHLERLLASADALGMQTERTVEEQLGRAVRRLLDLNKLKDAYIRITLTGGRGRDGKGGLLPSGPQRPTVIIENRAFKPYSDELYTKGMRFIISDYRRSTSNPITYHKTANFLVAITARQEALKKNADDALLLNTNEEVCEGTVWNVFMVEGGGVITPSVETNLLPGITRKTVIEICGRMGIPAGEEAFPAERLLKADEVFVTNSLAEIMPVAAIDDCRIGGKIPGKLTRRLMDAYKELTLTPA
ncbi:MAG: aminotransferase class IV [Candidatus Brocadiales bacterium]|nr:aminotransferase class IV [Candidatus Bathyanammoxibius amoris]